MWLQGNHVLCLLDVRHLLLRFRLFDLEYDACFGFLQFWLGRFLRLLLRFLLLRLFNRFFDLFGLMFWRLLIRFLWLLWLLLLCNLLLFAVFRFLVLVIATIQFALYKQIQNFFLILFFVLSFCLLV